MVYIRSSNEGEQETNYEARNESVVSKLCASQNFGRRAGFFFEEAGHLAIFEELEGSSTGSRALLNVRTVM
jgi:hypothetical protein